MSHRSGHRGRSAGTGDLHADAGLRARLRGLCCARRRFSRAIRWATGAFSLGRFLKTATADWPTASKRGPGTISTASITTTSMWPAAPWCRSSARPDVCITPRRIRNCRQQSRCPQPLRLSAKRWRGMTAWPILLSPCRGSVPARCRYSDRSAQADTGCTGPARGKAIAAFALSEPAIRVRRRQYRTLGHPGRRRLCA